MVSRGTARSALGVLRKGSMSYRDAAVVFEPAGAHTWDVSFPAPYGRHTSVSAPLPEGVTVARSLRASTARAYLAIPAARAVSAVAAPLGAMARMLAHTPAWALLHRGVELLPEGPPQHRRVAAQASIVAEVRAGDDSSSAWAMLRDIYGSTARLSVAVAMQQLDGAVDVGVRTPAQSGDPEQLLVAAGAAFAF